jgi:hypothetical protein
MMQLTLTIFGAAVVIILIGEAARIRSKQLDDQTVCRDEFFAATERLVADPETPEKIIQEMDRLAHVLTSRTILWGFVSRALTGRLRGTGSSREEYLAMPAHLRKDLVMAWVSAIFALTFNNMVLGAFIRRLMLYSVPRRVDGDFDSATPVAPMVAEFARDGVHSAA